MRLSLSAVSSNGPASLLPNVSWSGSGSHGKGKLQAILCRIMPAFLVMLLFSGCSDQGVLVQAQSTDAAAAMQAMLTTEQTAWNANDSATYASLYTDDADFINIRGQIFTGRAAIAQVHGMIFAGPFLGSNIVITLRQMKTLAPGVVMLDTDQVVTNYKGLPPGIVASSTGTLLTHFKYIAVQQGTEWKFISGQNTSALPN